MISCAVNTTSTACRNAGMSKAPSSARNFSRLRLARLQALLSRCMYSLHGLEALMRPLAGLVCHSLIVPALASAPRMNETGPLAVPPPCSCSLDERNGDRFTPEPDPPLKMVPSSVYQFRIERMESSTARMKHALHCGCSSAPTLNHT